jgi:hypothetical protein
MSIVVSIQANGVDVSNSIDWSSVDLLMVLTKEVSTLKFDIRRVTGKYGAQIGDTVYLYETVGAVKSTLFGGTITEIDTIVDGQKGGILLVDQVTCTDFGFNMNGLLVVQSYTATDPGTIVKNIVSTYCSGFTTNNVNLAGYTIPSIKFNYEPVTKCIEAIAKQIGWDWYVDSAKDVHFFLTEGTAAPFNIDDTSGNQEWPTIDVNLNLANLKNSVFVIGATYKSVLTAITTPDNYLGNGTQTVYYLRYKYIQSTMTVTVGGVSKTIGTANSGASGVYDVLYDSTKQNITFTATPANAAAIVVYGTAEIPIIGHALNQSSILKWGEYQDAIIDKQIKSIAEAQQRAQAEILQFGDQVHDVKFNTLSTGLRIGQTINVTSTIFNVSYTGSTALVIKRIEGMGYSPTQLRYNVQCLGSDNVTFVDLMSTILQQGLATNVTDDTTVLEVLLEIDETLTSSDSLSAPTSKTTKAYKWSPTAGQAGSWNLASWG